MFCRKCGREIPSGAKFCVECGTPAMPSTAMTPPAAGTSPYAAVPPPHNNASGTASYSYRAPAAPPVYSYPPMTEAPVQKKSKGPLVVVIVFVLLAAIGGAALLLGGEEDAPKETVDKALTQANQEAEELYDAAQTVIDAMSEEGYDVEDGYYIFTEAYEKPDEEPESGDVSVSEPDYLLWQLDEEYDNIEELEGFAFYVEDSEVQSAAVETEEYVGAYPNPVTMENAEDRELDEDTLVYAAQEPEHDHGRDADEEEADTTEEDEEETTEEDEDETESQEDEEALEINRETVEEAIPMGEDGTWTIFVYLCGSDLESKGWSASRDISEMMEASGNENVRFVIQTGGAKDWYYDEIDSDKMQRYVICDGEAEMVDELDKDNMGDGAVLTDFLRWGVENYPAARMGLVFWNHGGGSIHGVCFDEFTEDSLSLKEIDAALFSAREDMTDQFEFVGFDACLMGTVEAAALMASHSRYMVGSQELEPGGGWDYAAIGEYLTENPDADGAALGEVICDSYYEACEDVFMEDDATLSVIDLTKMDDVLIAFHDYAEDLYNLTEDEEDIAAVMRNIVDAENYGGNNWSEGYTNMVDLGGLVSSGSAYSDHAEEVLEALEPAVIYQQRGSAHSESSGLSIYYPLQVQGSQELGIFKDICISSYYLGFVDKIAYGLVNAGEISDYENDDVMDDAVDWDNDYTYDDDDNIYYYEEDNDAEQWEYVDDYEVTGMSQAITFDVEPFIDEDGYYGFYLSEDGLYNAASVQASVFLMSDDFEEILSLGISCDIYADWTEGYFCDNFDGYWFSLPDGQILSVYIVEEGYGYDVYTCPILLNGEETFLRIQHDYINGNVTVLGTWAGLDESGAAARETEPLQEGDVIVPVYYAYEVEDLTEYDYYGEEYVFEGDSEIYFDRLPDGEYLYGFYIDDFYGDYYATDYVNFTIVGEDIYFDDLSGY